MYGMKLILHKIKLTAKNIYHITHKLIESGPIRICDFVGTGIALLEEFCHCPVSL